MSFTRGRCLALVLLLCLPGAAIADVYGLVHLRSVHPEESNLTDHTPGFGIGMARDLDQRGTEWFVEGAFFSNSYDEPSPLVMAGLSTPLATIGPVEVRVGGAIGVGRYKKLCDKLMKRYESMPDTQSILPVVSASLGLRVGKTDLRLSAIPHSKMPERRPILNISLSRRF
ncbi:hypothetical protein SAMN04488020_11812 [Palleronia marisminoris]|uniref:Outer membrane protein beta-barrel domain-containing protein n=1 Tax=Palleronia marisminoris TaxID=315423 RepID=A0A1Y5TR76_9RHOB|nr:hypothetical protein [Palleronia marisminoris]SFH49884.1 hypothetical protein SAMN04488020_11812 [Palleronia marisminoris]SLN70234.1 hypothetical protein PAM7066_03555 [Palleronia marisminoris]